MRPIVATIDLAALRNNLAVARRAIAPGTRLTAVVKANAYGHGLARVRPALEAADALAVIELENAVLLREALSWDKPLMVLEGFYGFDEIEVFQRHHIDPVVHCVEQLDMLEAARGSALRVYLKFNTGMNRLGFALKDLPAVVARARACASVRDVVLTTHLARADETNGEAFQLAAWQAALASAHEQTAQSLANSAATMKHSIVGGNEVRPGIMLYGGSPHEGVSAAALGLLPVMQVNTKVIAIQNVAAGETVGYGGAFVASRPSRIAVLAGGYADGYPRHARQGTPVWVEGARVPLAGRVSMDKITVDVTDHPLADRLGVGASAQMWGDHIPADELASHAGTIAYDLFTGLAARVPVHTR